MSYPYLRVIPRDLFNEGNMLKCLGQVYLNLEKLNITNASIEHDGEAFDLHQNPDDGGLVALNVTLNVGESSYYFRRPLNSREAWPLYIRHWEWDEDLQVFNDNGEFSDKMVAFLKGAQNG